MAKTKRPESTSVLTKDVARRVRWARELVYPNRADLARTMDVDDSTLAKIEAAQRAPSIFYVIELSNRLRVTTDYILKGLLTDRGDPELVVKLAALHPELVLPPTSTEIDRDTAPTSDKRRTTKKPDHARPKIVAT